MKRFEHIRHKPPAPLANPRQLTLVCSALRNKVNLSRLVRLAGCSGLDKIIHCGAGKVDREIARDAVDVVHIETHRSLPPVLAWLREKGNKLIGLEQTTNSDCLYDFHFPQMTALVIGSEREGLSDEVLEMLDAVIEIPVYGRPYSHNVVTAATMAVYEYCRQFPDG